MLSKSNIFDGFFTFEGSKAHYDLESVSRFKIMTDMFEVKYKFKDCDCVEECNDEFLDDVAYLGKEAFEELKTISPITYKKFQLKTIFN
jgi:hypothetical protein